MPYTTNGLTIEVYTRGSVFQIPDPERVVALASGLQFTSAFPGGLYTDCSFYVPRRLAQYWDVRGAQRVVIRNGQKAVWEGKIDTLNSQSSGAEQGTLVQATGYWGALMMRYAIRKRWADTRITEDVWKWQTQATGAEKCTVDRNARIRFTPKAEAWTSGQSAYCLYTMPVGRTAKRITYSYDLQEGSGGGAQAWEIQVQRSTDALSFTTLATANGDTFVSGTTSLIAANGTGSFDITLGTPSRYLLLRYYARADQTPPTADGTYYGQFSNITVYDETGVIDAKEVGYDLIGACSELSTSLTGVYGLAGETLPAIDILVFDEFTSLADIAMDVAGYGNTSDESIYFQIRASEEAETNDGKPLLAAGPYPDLTSANYVVRLSDDNVVSADISRDYSQIKNWIAVNYTDERNEAQIITPDDASYTGLTDATSTAAYGRRVDSIQSGNLQTSSYLSQIGGYGLPGVRQPSRPNSASLAYYYGKRYLAKWKNPLWVGSITVVGSILGAGGNEIPASEIEAGKVLDIADFVIDEVLPSDTLDYPRVIVTATSYDAETEQCVISFGPIDDLKMIQIETLNFIPQATPATGGTDAGGGGAPDRLNWKRQYGLTPGTAAWDEAVRLGKKRWKAKYPNAKKVKTH